jgi:hypothetical protein
MVNKMKIDLEQIKERTGREFENIEQLYFYINYVMDYLKGFNKNYTKKTIRKNQ